MVLSIDPAWSGTFSAGLKAIDFEGKQYRIATYYEIGRGMQQNVNGVIEFIKDCKYTRGKMPDICIGGLDCWAKHDRYAIIGEELTYADLFEKKGITLSKAVTDRVPGWGAWKNLMTEGRWFYFANLNEPLVDEIQAAEHDEKAVEDIKGRGNDPEVIDHALDEERYSVMATYTPGQPKQKDKKKPRDYQGPKKKTFGGSWEPGTG